MHRAEVITVERRRRWSWSDKQQIVDETLVPGASISAVARRYGLHPSQVFAWRKAVREGNIEEAGCGFDGVFAPVLVTKWIVHAAIAGARVRAHGNCARQRPSHCG